MGSGGQQVQTSKGGTEFCDWLPKRKHDNALKAIGGFKGERCGLQWNWWLRGEGRGRMGKHPLEASGVIPLSSFASLPEPLIPFPAPGEGGSKFSPPSSDARLPSPTNHRSSILPFPSPAVPRTRSKMDQEGRTSSRSGPAVTFSPRPGNTRSDQGQEPPQVKLPGKISFRCLIKLNMTPFRKSMSPVE